MKTLLKIFTISFLLLFPACKASANIKSTYAIPLDTYEDRADNIALASQLVSYDHIYIMSHIKSYDPDKMANGITLGINVPFDEETNPTYRYTLKLNNKAVKNNAKSLAADFDAFIPQLIETHISKLSLYEELADPAEDWLNLILENKLEKAYEQSGSLMKDMISFDQLTEMVTQLKSQFGDIQSTRYLYGHFYDNFQGQSQLVNIFFEQEFSDDQTWTNSVMMGQEDGKWIPVGFFLSP